MAKTTKPKKIALNSKEINKPDMPLYNFNVSNDNSYIANGYVVHNKGGGGGKIVCTMMNESYGFGSFRNKIWLKHSKDLAPEYQIGYHKIFLPLVRLSKTNKLLKKTLEHIAVHRTIDIRQEERGKNSNQYAHDENYAESTITAKPVGQINSGFNISDGSG